MSGLTLFGPVAFSSTYDRRVMASIPSTTVLVIRLIRVPNAASAK